MNKLIPFFLIALLTMLPQLVVAEVGTVANLLGKIHLKDASGALSPLKKGDKVEVGSIVVSEEGAYGQIKFVDKGEMIIRPNSEIKINVYSFDKLDAKKDKIEIELVKGGLRRLTGLVGKRGNLDADKTKTPTATVGIRGTVFEALTCNNDCSEIGLTNGEYFATKTGQIAIDNGAGEVVIAAGQFAKASTTITAPGQFKSQGAPKKLDKDPGMPPFNPPKNLAPKVNGCAA
tara:strand:- start:2015 stop:2710 length:696 start_codon:yes stop_codon:yes gene_type:complete